MSFVVRRGSHGRIPEGTAADVDAAVRAARAAFEGGGDTRRRARGVFAEDRGWAEGALRGDRQDHRPGSRHAVQTGHDDSGRLADSQLRRFAKLLSEFQFEERVGNSLVVREPAGVVVAITPWNYPLHQIAAKVAPALAAGCTIVLKPSEVAPINAFIFAEIIDAAGLPKGVFNLVSGHGSVVGEALVRHPEVDMVSFTGSTRAGKRVSELAARRSSASRWNWAARAPRSSWMMRIWPPRSKAR